MTDIVPLPNPNVYKYKANDPYYFEVDNKPLDELEANDNHLQNTLQTVNDETELKLDDQEVTDKINTQYTTVTIPWADGKFFDEDELFVVGSKMSGLHPRGTSTEVYTRGEIEWDPAQFTNGNLFTQFLRSFIVDPANLPVDSGGNPWGWGTGERLFSFFYDKATIDALTFNVSRLTTEDVDAVKTRSTNDPFQGETATQSNPFITATDAFKLVTKDESDALHSAAGPTAANPFATLSDVSQKDEVIFNALLPLANSISIPGNSTWTDVLTQDLVLDAPPGEYRATIYYTCRLTWVGGADSYQYICIGFDSSKDSLDTSWFPSTNPGANTAPPTLGSNVHRQEALFRTNIAGSYIGWGYGQHPTTASTTRPIGTIFESPPVISVGSFGRYLPYVGYGWRCDGGQTSLHFSSRPGGMVQDFTLGTTSNICFKALSKGTRTMPASVEECRIVLELLRT